MAKQEGASLFWRREWDSNPHYKCVKHALRYSVLFFVSIGVANLAVFNGLWGKVVSEFTGTFGNILLMCLNSVHMAALATNSESFGAAVRAS